MRAIKIYLVVVSVLLIFAIGAGVYVWYLVQKLNTTTGGAMQSVETGTSTVAIPRESTYESPAQQEVPSTTPTLISTSTPSTSIDSDVPTEPIVVDIESMSPSQKKILESLGYTSGSLTITPAMIACAEDAIGKDRLDEIINGSTPTPLESLKLLPCFKS